MDTIRLSQRGSAQTTVIVGAVIAVLFLYFLFRLITSGVKIDPDDASDAAINSRIQSVGMVSVSDGVEPGTRTGEQVFDKTCNQCHASDATVANSPKLGNNAEWAPRIAKGFDTLISNAINGFNNNAMPARGGNPDLTDDEIARAIAFMANQSGANFTAPPAPSEAPAEAPAEQPAEAPAAEAPAEQPAQ
ncbi:MAG: cytochrome c5 family protein [Neisseriaceae bacterium]|nr:cytochrome c5 family protein [Neisseriaceae bacterium]